MIRDLERNRWLLYALDGFCSTTFGYEVMNEIPCSSLDRRLCAEMALLVRPCLVARLRSTHEHLLILYLEQYSGTPGFRLLSTCELLPAS